MFLRAIDYIHIFLQLMRRDCYVYAHQVYRYIINYLVVYPLILSFFYYMQKQLYFDGASPEKSTQLFIGCLIVPLLVISYTISIDLLFDLENNRFVQYQMRAISPRVLLVQRIVFIGLFTFFLTAPLFPLVAFISKGHMTLEHMLWLKYVVILLISSFCCASYNILAMCYMSSNQIQALWVRINGPLMNLGGLWVPLAAIKSFSPLLGYIAYANPILYIIEGMRRTALNSDLFLSFELCSLVLLVFTIVFTVASWRIFKRRLDHI